MTIDREFGYARAADGAYIAYVTAGDGPIDLLWQLDWFGNVDVVWEEPTFRRLFEGLASFTRLILHDRRATGLSSRDVDVPNLETRVGDVVAVLDAVGAERPVLGGVREGGAANVLLAATMPARVRSLVWYAPLPTAVWSPDYPWGVTPEYVAEEERVLELWGTRSYGERFIEQERTVGHDVDPAIAAMIAKLSRHTTTPDIARKLGRIWYETDIRPLLPAVTAPTLLIDYGETDDADASLAYVAERMPDARTLLLQGAEADADMESFVEAVRGFLGLDRPPVLDTVLTTVLFTDIVDSTSKQARLGDRGWKRVIEGHHATVRDALDRFRGDEQDTAGDGFYARFDGPARAIRCAQEIARNVRDLGVEIRAGVHTGECEVADGKCSGLSVSIGARVMSHAGPSDVLVSQTVKDLVAGSRPHVRRRRRARAEGHSRPLAPVPRGCLMGIEVEANVEDRRLSYGNFREMSRTDFLSVPEVAEILGITRQAVLKRIRAGSLEASKVGRNYIVPAAAIPRDHGSDPILAEIVQRLVAAYRPERVYLFGSSARGDRSPGSDYDLLLVVPDDATDDRLRARHAYEALWGLERSGRRDRLAPERVRSSERWCPPRCPRRCSGKGSGYVSHDEVAREADAWLSKARNDLRAARVLLAADPPLPGDAAFHCQQSVEKSLKAFLTLHVIRSRGPTTSACSRRRASSTSRGSTTCCAAPPR